MPDAVIVSTARTALARSWRGAFNATHGATLGGHAVRHAMERARLDPADVDDVVIGARCPKAPPAGTSPGRSRCAPAARYRCPA